VILVSAGTIVIVTSIVICLVVLGLVISTASSSTQEVVKTSDGTTIIGTVKEGELDGLAAVTMPDGTRYHGYFRHGHPIGLTARSVGRQVLGLD
jgi:hypothetical protein